MRHVPEPEEVQLRFLPTGDLPGQEFLFDLEGQPREEEDDTAADSR